MCNSELMATLTRAGLASYDNRAMAGAGGGADFGAGGAGMPQGFYGSTPEGGFGLLRPMLPAGALPVGEAALPPGMAPPQAAPLPQPVPQGTVPTGRPAVRPQPQRAPGPSPMPSGDMAERQGGRFPPGYMEATAPAPMAPPAPTMAPQAAAGAPGLAAGLGNQIWGRTGLTNAPVGSTITMPSFSVPPMPPEMQAALAAGIENPPMPGGFDPLAGRMAGGAAAGAFNPMPPSPGPVDGLPWWNWSARAQARYPRRQ